MTLAAAVAAMLLALPAYASASTLYVDDQGSDSVGANLCTDPNDPCATIGHAVAIQIGSGNTIDVGGGTYHESVTLAKDETLIGSAFASTAPGVTTTLPAVIDGSAAACPNDTITVSSTATVQALTIRSQSGCRDLLLDTGSGSAVVQGDSFDDAAKTVEDLTVTAGAPSILGNGFLTGQTSGDQTGIVVSGASSPAIGGPGSAANSFQGFARAIVVGVSGAGGATPSIDGNAIDGIHPGTAVAGVGVDIGFDSNPSLSDNSIATSTAGSTIGVRIVEDTVTPATTRATLSRNQITGVETGLADTDAGLVTLSQDAIRSNGGGAIVATDTINGGGNVSAKNVDLIDANSGFAASLNSTLLSLDSSIVGGGTASSDEGIDANGTASCTIVFSRGPSSSNPPCAGFATHDAPHFVGSTLELTSSNPNLIDFGNPVTSFGMVDDDLYGHDRIVDGDRDCDARIDIGAAEFQISGQCLHKPTTSVRERSLYEFLNISSEKKLGNYRLCVDGPGPKQCKTFRAAKRHGKFTDSVNWARKFTYRGAGHYTVKWFSGSHQLGQTRTYDWGPCAPRNLTMKGVWRPSRLQVINRCKVAYVLINGSFTAFDGDYHIKVNPIGSTAGSMKNFEIIPRDRGRIPRPAGGRRVRIVGVDVCDTFHNAHREFHPVFEMDYLKPNSTKIARRFISGPERGGTPSVQYTPNGRFHCAGL
ncbi:MAG: hypothetical protein QOJ38_536 [Solirubrobacterales bacterium]|nr:hypothetical protein [Solirubrobacterales bacterium]